VATETIEEIRSRNFLLLFEQFKADIRKDWPGEPDRGMLRRFAERLGIGRIAASHHNNGKFIGTVLADRFEKAFGLEDGWMDRDHSTAPATEQETAFIRDALKLFRKSPVEAQAELIRAFSKNLAQ
jgi:hypothetical protein